MPTIDNDWPQMDWSCRDIVDAKVIDPVNGQSTCEFCGTAIRWIHVLEHDDYLRSMRAGCCCAAKFCFDYDAPAAERDMKNRMGRLSRFVDVDRWTRSRMNPENIWRWVKPGDGKKVRVTVYQRYGAYGIYIDGLPHWGKYGTQAEALNVAFELVEGMKSNQSGGG